MTKQEKPFRKIAPPRGSSPEFRKYWDKFVINFQSRENFHHGHLKNLEILCNLYLEYDAMTKVIQEEGFSYLTEGRYGVQKKTTPEVSERAKVLAEIRQYSRLLDIVISRDSYIPETTEEDDW